MERKIFMPKIKSAIKRVKTSKKSYLRNTSYKSKIKSNIKKFNLSLLEKNKEETNKYFKDSVLFLDKSVNKGILPKNTASRKKSRLAKKLNVLIMPTPQTEIEKTTKVEKKPKVKKTTKTTEKK
jgi:small subunit ribosomal protein S20